MFRTSGTTKSKVVHSVSHTLTHGLVSHGMGEVTAHDVITELWSYANVIFDLWPQPFHIYLSPSSLNIVASFRSFNTETIEWIELSHLFVHSLTTCEREINSSTYSYHHTRSFQLLGERTYKHTERDRQTHMRTYIQTHTHAYLCIMVAVYPSSPSTLSSHYQHNPSPSFSSSPSFLIHSTARRYIDRLVYTHISPYNYS